MWNIGTEISISKEPQKELSQYSINVQLICDADLIITNCVAKWPGSAHDARILRECAFFQAFESPHKLLEGIILGDSGYMIRSWLMTPFQSPSNQRERRYNRAHAATRVTVERVIGVLKRRWACLHQGLRVQPPKACKIIYACVLLHNRAKRLGLDDPPEDDSLVEDNNNGTQENQTERQRSLAGKAVRARIVNQNF